VSAPARLQLSTADPTFGTSRSSRPPDDVAAAWESAQLAAQFLALIGVRCQAEGHEGDDCIITRVAMVAATRALAVAQELADTSVEVAA
jgi:hypothetical protein